MELKKIKRKKVNKRGQFESRMLAIILIFIIGVLLIFFNKLNNELYGSLDEYFNQSEDYNNSLAHDAVQDIKDVENSVWDYAFLAIFIGIIIQVVLFSFATRINMAFYWLMMLVDIPVLVLGVIVSAIWQELAANPEFAEQIAIFPITNTLLGTYFPIATLFIIFIGSIILFGKRPTETITQPS
jgi:hypothetical protein